MPLITLNFPHRFISMPAILIFSSATLIAAPPSDPSTEMPPPVTLLHDSVVDAAGLNFPEGRYGTCINGQTYQQEAVISLNGYQYTAYFAHGGALSLARRRLPDGPWKSFQFDDYQLNHTNIHNGAVLGICPKDGTIHIAFDHHVSPLHYRRSRSGLATNPDQFAWNAESFGEITSALEPGKPLSDITYPMFVTTPRGNLQLMYRIGGSGSGDWHLAEYNPDRGGWTQLGVLFSRVGHYKTSQSRSAYPNPIRYGPDGRLHVTWCWRERPSDGTRDLRTNHDLCYAFSDDEGRTWKNNAGEVIARLSPSSADGISIDSPGTVVAKCRYLWGQMNTTTQWIDAEGRVHVVNWKNPPDAKTASTDLNQWRYFHYWRDTSGTWHEQKLPFHGRKPQIVLDNSGNAYVVFTQGQKLEYHNKDHGGPLVIQMSSRHDDWKTWKEVWRSEEEFVGEPLLDTNRCTASGVLSIYAQEKPAVFGAPSKLHVIDIKTAETPQGD